MDKETLKKTLKDALRNTPNEADIFKTLKHTVHSLETELPHEQFTTLVTHLKNWRQFAGDKPHARNSFEARHYIQKFAQQTLGKPTKHVQLHSISINHLSHNGKSFHDWVGDIIDARILTDENTAIYGGVARAALKLHAHVCAKAEFPFLISTLLQK